MRPCLLILSLFALFSVSCATTPRLSVERFPAGAKLCAEIFTPELSADFAAEGNPGQVDSETWNAWEEKSRALSPEHFIGKIKDEHVLRQFQVFEEVSRANLSPYSRSINSLWQSKAYLSLRAAVFDIFNQPHPTELEILEVSYLIEAHRYLNMGFAVDGNWNSPIPALQVFGYPEYEHTLRALGKVISEARQIDPESLSQAITALAHETRGMSAEMLDSVVHDFSRYFSAKLAETRESSPGYSRTKIQWDAKAIHNITEKWILLFAETATAHRKLLEKEFPNLPSQTQAEIAGAMTTYFNSRTLDILRRTLPRKWFREQGPLDQAKLFSILNFVGYQAEQSESPHQRRTLSNTLNYLLDQNIPIFVKAMKPRGTAAPHGISLQEAMAHLFGSRHIRSEAWDLALDVLPHEVSHMISGQGVEESVVYFEEEYRAWQVGMGSKLGRMPTKHEQFNVVVDLLTNAAQSDAYAYIARAWQKNPAAFFTILRDFGFTDPGILIGKRAGEMRTLGSSHLYKTESYPQLGWEGYLFNEPKPAP